jgi:hypothetical protein
MGKPRTALRADEKIDDPETAFERFKQAVSKIASAPKNGVATTGKRRPKAAKSVKSRQKRSK